MDKLENQRIINLPNGRRVELYFWKQKKRYLMLLRNNRTFEGLDKPAWLLFDVSPSRHAHLKHLFKKMKNSEILQFFSRMEIVAMEPKSDLTSILVELSESIPFPEVATKTTKEEPGKPPKVRTLPKSRAEKKSKKEPPPFWEGQTGELVPDSRRKLVFTIRGDAIYVEED